jgi:hypothetical protein
MQFFRINIETASENETTRDSSICLFWFKFFHFYLTEFIDLYRKCDTFCHRMLCKKKFNIFISSFLTYQDASGCFDVFSRVKNTRLKHVEFTLKTRGIHMKFLFKTGLKRVVLNQVSYVCFKSINVLKVQNKNLTLKKLIN